MAAHTWRQAHRSCLAEHIQVALRHLPAAGRLWHTLDPVHRKKSLACDHTKKAWAAPAGKVCCPMCRVCSPMGNLYYPADIRGLSGRVDRISYPAVTLTAGQHPCGLTSASCPVVASCRLASFPALKVLRMGSPRKASLHHVLVACQQRMHVVPRTR